MVDAHADLQPTPYSEASFRSEKSPKLLFGFGVSAKG